MMNAHGGDPGGGVVDTSGSMEESDLALALGVIGNALRSLPDPRGLRILAGYRAQEPGCPPDTRNSQLRGRFWRRRGCSGEREENAGADR
jgi:hypothetical protein